MSEVVSATEPLVVTPVQARLLRGAFSTSAIDRLGDSPDIARVNAQIRLSIEKQRALELDETLKSCMSDIAKIAIAQELRTMGALVEAGRTEEVAVNMVSQFGLVAKLTELSPFLETTSPTNTSR